MNDLSIVDGVVVAGGEATSLAAAPPRGGNIDVATAAAVKDGRFIGWNGEHSLVAHDIWMEMSDMKRMNAVAEATRLGLGPCWEGRCTMLLLRLCLAMSRGSKVRE